MQFETEVIGMSSISRRSFLAATAVAGSALVASPAWAAETAGNNPTLVPAAVSLDASSQALLDKVPSVVESNPKLSASVVAREYSGADRYETSASIAKAAYPSGSESAIIVGGEQGWPDALSAACLSPAKGPILLVGKSSVPTSVLNVLQGLGVKSVVIVGGLPSVGAGVQVALEKAGISVEKRLGGADRYATQLEVFNYGIDNGFWEKDLMIVATGERFPDALSASPISYAKRAPIFLAGANGTLSSAQQQAWRDAAKKGYGKNVIVLGDTASVSAAGKAFADEMRTLANGSGSAERLAGPDRYSTSSAIAEWAVKSLGFKWDGVAYATGQKPWDALTGSVFQGASRSVLMVADSMSSPTVSKARSNKGSIKNLRFFGSKASVVPSVRMSLADALGFPVAALPNFKLYLDAGHGPDNGSGNYDPGASGSGYWEYDLTKELVNKIAPLLRAQGVNVFVNDDGGYYKLRHGEAVSLGCDAILSIHFNASGGSGSLSLIHSYHANEYSRTWQGKIHPHLISGMGLSDRGQLTQEVAILGGQLPAVLLETCFIDNARDMSTYQSRKNIVASEIAKGIMS